MRPQNVSFIGAGNVAWHLAPALDNTEFAVREIYARNPSHAQALAEKLYQGYATQSLNFASSASRIFIIAVADDAIQEIASEIILPDDSILVHTSGSIPLSVLGYAAATSTGVFYPLQTFTKGRKIDLKEVPILIESEDTETEKLLMAMAKAISSSVRRANSADRRAIHVAGVFASNFTNHMLNVAADLMRDQQLDFDLLRPLIVETINKALILGPAAAQTGPARRADFEVLDKHMTFLEHDPELAAIYRLISQRIVDQYHPD